MAAEAAAIVRTDSIAAAVMLSVARSRFALPTQFLFLIINAFGMLVGIIYNGQTPDLYENNAHHKIGWVATWVVSAQVIMSLIFAYAGRGDADVTAFERAAFLPVSTDEMAGHPHSYPSGAIHEYRWSRDSGQGTERNSCSIRSGPSSPTCVSPSDEYDDFEKPNDDVHDKPVESRKWFRNTFVDRFLASRVPGMVSSRVLSILNVVYMVIDRIILPFGFIAICTGGVTYGGIMVSLFFAFCHSLPFSYNLKISSCADTCLVEGSRSLQRACAFHQGRYLLLVRLADARTMAGMLVRLWLGLEREAIGGDCWQMEGQDPHRRIRRIFGDLLVRRQQCLP